MLLSIDIDAVDALADGAPFGQVGPYERITGIAHGEIDPDHPANRGIALLAQAPRNTRGRVEYSTGVYILRPRDAARGSGRLLYEVNNRGRKMLFSTLADAPAGVNDPRSLADLGNAFPLTLGHVLVWSGWDPGAPRAKGGLALDAPVASADGLPIVQRVRDEFVSGTRIGVLEMFRLSHQAASTAQDRARLTVREREADTAHVISPADWSFTDAYSIRLREGLAARPGHLYEFHYDAINPRVQGLGFAATRDVVSHLRHHPAGIALTGRPMSHALAIGISQAGRYLRDHVGQGFNRDEDGRRVFDGVLSHIAGVGRVFLNAPFAQPARTCTQHEDHRYPENAFPFSAATLTDPLTGLSASLLRGDASDPLLIESNTSTEYWQKGASLLHTDPLGERDVELPEGARVYLIAGTQHGGRAGMTADPGPAVNPRNPHNPMPAVRALLVALDAWVAHGVTPPPSQVPRLADGTLVEPQHIEFPAIPGAAIVRVANRINPPGDWVEPAREVGPYAALVCRVDADGNEVAGIRLPDIAVPLATYTGWNAYKAPYPTGELADRDGSCLAFAPDEAARKAAGDPRPSIAQRYRDRHDYVGQVREVALALVHQRLLLAQDADAYVERALADPRLPDQ